MDTKPNPARQFSVTALRLNAKAADAAAIVMEAEELTLSRGDADVVVRIHAAGVNPSDIKAATGLMPYAVFPRTPGRDFAGEVVDGPPEWIGCDVFGSSGDLGIRRDGTHATHVVVEVDALVAKPVGMMMEEAAGVGVPFVTAMEGFRRTGAPKPSDTVVIFGVNGKVGQAAAQLATWQGARVIGVARKDEGYAGHANGPVEMINSSATDDVAARVRELTDGRGAQIAFNTVGEDYFDAAERSLALAGFQILIATSGKPVSLNILQFYRGRHTLVGVDTLALSSVASGALLRSALPGFASGHLRAFPINGVAVYPLSDAKAAYTAVIGSSRDRVILKLPV